MTVARQEYDGLTREDTARTADRRGGVDVLKAQKGFARLAVAFIVAGSMVLTYDGTMRFAQAHGALGWRGAVIALMNDLAVLVGILWPEKPFQALAALCSILTIWANVDHAGPGPAGVVVALVPPTLAILMVIALEIQVRRVKPDLVVALPDPPMTQPVITVTPVDLPPVKEIEASDPLEATTREARAAWVKDHGPMTLAQIMETWGVSDSTAKRIRQLV
jgi:hypothetical protein